MKDLFDPDNPWHWVSLLVLIALLALVVGVILLT
jgi:hypothetical protein